MQRKAAVGQCLVDEAKGLKGLFGRLSYMVQSTGIFGDILELISLSSNAGSYYTLAVLQVRTIDVTIAA